MTEKAHPEDDKPNAVFLHKEPSETAATVGRPLYGPSGIQTYRVLLVTGMGGSTYVDVEAATGDEAADKALQQAGPGAKVTNIAPAPQTAQRKDAA